MFYVILRSVIELLFYGKEQPHAMLAVSSPRPLLTGWQRLAIWIGRLLMGAPEAAVAQPALSHEQAHLRNLAGRRYPISPTHAHLYARAADEGF